MSDNRRLSDPRDGTLLAAKGIAVGKRRVDSALGALASPEGAGGIALDALLSSGAIGAREHAAGVAYRALRRRFEEACRSARRGGAGLALPEAAWFALKRRHEALIGAAGFERFALDRLTLDDEAPLRCEVERVRRRWGGWRSRSGEGGMHARRSRHPRVRYLG